MHYRCAIPDPAKVKASTAPDWRDGFLFVGNQLALDFLNTRLVQNGEPLELIPDFHAVIRWFRAAGLLTSRQAGDIEQQWDGSPRARNFEAAIRRFRESLRKEIVAWGRTAKPSRGALEELNRLMADHPMLTRVRRGAHGTTAESWFKASEPEDVIAPLAHSAATLFATGDRSRVRKCGNCVVHFYDTSKNGTRRWCSMQLCGNRSKVAAYAARHRGADEAR